MIEENSQEPHVCGIDVDEDFGSGYPYFNFDDDYKGDVLHLSDISNTDIPFEDSVRYVSVYKYNKDVDSEKKELVENFLKELGTDINSMDLDECVYEDVLDFVISGVNLFDDYWKLNNFPVIIDLEKDPKLDTLDWMLSSFASTGIAFQGWRSTPVYMIRKNKLEFFVNNLKFDTDYITNLLRTDERNKEDDIEAMVNNIHRRFDDWMSEHKLYLFVEFIESLFDQPFTNFLAIDTNWYKNLLGHLQGVDILLIYQFIPQKEVVDDTLKLLKSIHPNNKLTVLSLVEQEF